MKHRIFGFLVVAGIASVAAGPSAKAVTGTTVIPAPFSVSGSLDGQQTITIPGFSGPGTLTSVEAVYTVNDYVLAIYTDSSQGGQVSDLTASNTLLLTQPALFQITPTTLGLSIPSFSIFVGAGNNNFLTETYISSPTTASFTTTTNLSDFANGPFVFTVAASGTFSYAPNPDVVATPSVTADGILTVTYTFDVDAATPVPEPASLALLGPALLGLAAVRRRRGF